jgi:nitrite reductase (NADH) large subunit
VCGSPRAEFEAYVEEAPRAPVAAGRQQCLNCGYTAAGEAPPAECPVCGAAQDRFETVGEAAAIERGDAGTRVVVVGAGIAGISALESIRTAAPGAEVVLVSKEAELPYYRLNLTRLLAGEIDEGDLPLHPESWYEENRVELRLGAEVGEIRPVEREIRLRNGDPVSYGKLVLTAGAHPFIPPMAGAHREGVFSLRTVEDARALLATVGSGVRCLCIGGGLLGLESAAALARRGAEVTVLEGHAWLMPRQLNRRAGEILAAYLAGHGTRVRLESRIREIVGDERLGGVLLEDGTHLEADCVVVATGVRPNSYLARRAGLEVGQGVVVDNLLTSSHPDVLAAGDVAEHRGVLYGNWFASQYQGKIAGLNAVGLATEFGGIPRSNTLKVVGLDLLSVGKVEPEDGSYHVAEEETADGYARFLFHDGRLVGAVLLGDTSAAALVKKGIEAGCECSALLLKQPTPAEVMEHLNERAAAV